MKKRLMLILALGVSFTSLSFAAETGQNQLRSEIPSAAIDCAAGLRAKDVETPQPKTTWKSSAAAQADSAGAAN